MNLNFKNFSPSALKQFASFAAHLWHKLRTLLFFIFSLAIIALGVYIWQQSLFGKGWDDARKQEYINSQSRRVIFKEEEFGKILNDIQVRKNVSENQYQPSKDIFKPY